MEPFLPSLKHPKPSSCVVDQLPSYVSQGDQDISLSSKSDLDCFQAPFASNYITLKKDCKWQFVQPSNHRVNAAERVIQTFKNHFISGLYATDKNWPLQLWNQLTHQATITLNLLRTSRIYPTKSAYEQIHGAKYDWNKHPMAPPCTRAIVYEAPDRRASW